MNEQLNWIAKEVAKSGAGVLVADTIDLPSKVNLGDSMAMKALSNGTVNFLVSDVIDYLDEGTGKLFHMKWREAVDDALFFSASLAVGEALSLDDMVANTLSNSVGLKGHNLGIAVGTVVLSSTRVLAKYIDESPMAPQILKSVRHPTQLLGY